MQSWVGFTNYLPGLLVVCSGSTPLNEPVYNTTNTDVNFGSFSINSSILPSSLTNTEQDATSTTKLPVTRSFGSANVPTGQPTTTTQTNVLTNIRPAANGDKMNNKLESKTTPLLARTKLVRKLLEPLTWGKVVAPIQDGPVKVISKVSSDICPFLIVSRWLWRSLSTISLSLSSMNSCCRSGKLFKVNMNLHEHTFLIAYRVYFLLAPFSVL